MAISINSGEPTMRLICLPWQQLSASVTDRTIAVIPVGSTEQHGLHLPLGADTFIACALADELAEDDRAIVLPEIAYRVSEYHRHYGGTLWERPEVFKAYVDDIVTSFAFHEIRRILFVNGHGGNVTPLQEICRFRRMESGIYGLVFTWFEAIHDVLVNVYGSLPPLHADEAETAMMMAVRRDLVLDSQIQESAKGAAARWGKWYSGVMVSQEVADFSVSGATGHPDEASEEKGRLLFESSVAALKSVFNWMYQLPPDQLGSKSRQNIREKPLQG